jgi:hypothetical protein
MSQPQFQPQPGQPPQPNQPPQPPQYNPYAAQPGVPPQMPMQPPGPPPMPPQQPGPPPMQAPGQPPVQPPGLQAWPGQPWPGYPVQPGQQQPRRGNPAGAFFLAFLVSFLLTVVYALVRGLAWHLITTEAAAITVWALATLVNGAAVGLVAGKVGGDSAGVRAGAAVVGALGAFFSSTNAAIAMTIAVGGWTEFVFIWKDNPFYPAASWWGTELHWLSVLGLVVAGGLAFGLALAVGKKRR